MFDPLDFLSASVKSEANNLNSEHVFLTKPLKSKSRECLEDLVIAEEPSDDIDTPIEVIDLPFVQIAKPMVILAVLLLLTPAIDVNFKKNGGNGPENLGMAKTVPTEYLEEVIDYYKYMGNSELDSADKLCVRIPRLAATATEKDLLTYYTTVLAKYSRTETSDELIAQLLKEASMRISEKCGRTAQPAMTRVFQVDSLQNCIKLHEPALTSDNLGLKTWGASLVLARKLCQNLQKITALGKDLRILELGAGTGLVGIALIQKLLEGPQDQVFTFHLTDLPEIVPNLKKNVELNKCDRTARLPVYTDVLDWTNPTSFKQQHGFAKFDVLLLADPLYSPQHPKWIVNMIVEFLEKQGKVFLGIPARAKYTKERQELWDLLDKAGFCMINEEAEEGMDDWGKVSYLYKEIVYKASA
ncbi:LANO_0H02168g1_1 [Lachancea nothofagi CBS 11611]|uniref:LANO_0H02168g1_1 n=1 Tax=Lachancea nothofagi CBS 11611 TaxID=1266666 RepID=A0A1G4KLA6_9SACH|nr:LANO_0H02168g1_1 [Lachancea nothofagi CBS 11611]